MFSIRLASTDRGNAARITARTLFLLLFLAIIAAFMLGQRLFRSQSERHRMIPVWVMLLNDDSKYKEAAKALRDTGPSALPYIMDMIADRQSRLTRLCGWLEQRWPSLARALPRPWPQPDARTAGIKALALLGAESVEAVSLLCGIWDACSEDEQIYAAQAFYSMGPVAREAVPCIAKVLESTNAFFSLNAPAILASLDTNGATVLPLLMPLLQDGGRRRSAISAIGSLGIAAKPAVPALIELLAASDHTIRLASIDALLRIGEQRRDLFQPILMSSLTNASRSYLVSLFEDRYAARLLGKLNPPPMEAIPILTDWLKPANTLDVRFTAAEALWNMRCDTGKLAAIFGEFLGADKSDRIMGRSAQILGEMGAAGRSQLPALRQAMRHYAEEIPRLPKFYPAIEERCPSLYVAEAFCRVAPEFRKETIPVLIAFLNAEEMAVRIRAARLLGEFGLPTPECLDALKAASKTGYSELAREASHARQNMQSESAF